MKEKIKNELKGIHILLRNIPCLATIFFAISVIAMNLLANKSINLPVSWLALDAGILISWMAFMSMDVITKHFGPKAGNEISVITALINLIMCLIFFIASKIPGMWGQSYVDGSETLINNALDKTFGGEWYVLLGSTIAFLASSLVNNVLNWLIGKTMKKDNFFSFAMRSYVSTAIGQLVDNLVFAFIVSYFFFGWSVLQCFTCAATGMVVELLCEVIFSPLGYAISKNWTKEGVGKEYFAYYANLAGAKEAAAK